MQVERGGPIWGSTSGGRVSNAWLTYPLVGDNWGKPQLIPHKLPLKREESRKAPGEGAASYQVVGGVKAHQADDG